MGLSSARSGTRASVATGDLVLLLGLCLVWGVNWSSMRVALMEVPPWGFRAACLVVGASGLFAAAALAGHRIRPERREIAPLLLVALFNVTGWQMLSAFALIELPAGRGAIIAFTMPLWATLLARVVLGEPLTGRKLSGLALGLAALALLAGGDLGLFGAAPVGVLLMLGAALSWALGTIAIKCVDWRLDAPALAAWQLAIGGLPTLAGAIVTGQGIDPAALSGRGTAALIYSSVIGIVFTQWAWFRLLGRLPASVASINTMLVPVLGVAGGAAMLGESVGLREGGALLLVVAGQAIVLTGARAR